MQAPDRLLSDGAANNKWTAAETFNPRELGADCIVATGVNLDEVKGGIGIGTDLTPEQKGGLFNPQRDVSTTRRSGDTGLGPAICLQPVDLMAARSRISCPPPMPRTPGILARAVEPSWPF
jgi:hypothetical protein